MLAHRRHHAAGVEQETARDTVQIAILRVDVFAEGDVHAFEHLRGNRQRLIDFGIGHRAFCLFICWRIKS